MYKIFGGIDGDIYENIISTKYRQSMNRKNKKIT
nr:MAG TPA: U4/U6 small nuclear ribonucleoprotein [Bacteriophage sp.]DAY55207.1 MAG TPA: U4/U6 small nuclear ribonucleoprotein [Caudoviricetes sp.]